MKMFWNKTNVKTAPVSTTRENLPFFYLLLFVSLVALSDVSEKCRELSFLHCVLGQSISGPLAFLYIHPAEVQSV